MEDGRRTGGGEVEEGEDEVEDEEGGDGEREVDSPRMVEQEVQVTRRGNWKDLLPWMARVPDFGVNEMQDGMRSEMGTTIFSLLFAFSHRRREGSGWDTMLSHPPHTMCVGVSSDMWLAGMSIVQLATSKSPTKKIAAQLGNSRATPTLHTPHSPTPTLSSRGHLYR